LFFVCPPPSGPPPYTVSLHDALPIFSPRPRHAMSTSAESEARKALQRLRRAAEKSLRELDALEGALRRAEGDDFPLERYAGLREDRKSTRLNSSHVKSSYAVFCLKKK